MTKKQHIYEKLVDLVECKMLHIPKQPHYVRYPALKLLCYS